jgi:hypothetical protein
VISAISAFPCSLSMKAAIASRSGWIIELAAWLSSMSSATCSGSVAGPALSTSRATRSSRTVKSAAVSPAIGAPFESTTLT